MKISRRNKDINQLRKSCNFGVSEMDQNRVEKRKFLGCCHVLFLAISWPTDLKFG